jgi:hypothetical protein
MKRRMRVEKSLYFLCVCKRVRRKPLESLGANCRCTYCGEMMTPYAIMSHAEYFDWLISGGNVLSERDHSYDPGDATSVIRRSLCPGDNNN